MSKNTELHTFSNSLAAAVETAGASVVTVAARRRIPASGVVIRPGVVLTASHVVHEDEIRVTLPDGREVAAELLGRDPASDLAVLKLAEEAGQPAQTSDKPQVGQLALALGRPGGEVQASLGIVSAAGGPVPLRRGGVLAAYLRTDAVPYPGFSGGPLVDAEGRVLGINTSGLGWGAGLTIPAELAWQTAASIEEHGGVKRGYLGLRSQLVELSAEARKALKREQASGLLVISVEDESPAAAAGLIVGDILTGLGDQPVEDHDELMVALHSGLAGQAVEAEVLRGGKPQKVKVTVGEQEATHRGRGRRRHGKGHGRGFGGRLGQRMWKHRH